MPIPKKFAYLLQEPLAPLMVRIGLDMLGLIEGAGDIDNPVITAFADEVARAHPTTYNRWAGDFYNKDSIPWCGLWMAVVACRAAQGRAERLPPPKYLAALSWSSWGVPVALEEASVGDVMVLVRQGGGHVTMNVGMTPGGKSFFGLGANQNNRVSIAEFGCDRVYAVRRPPYLERPPGARRVFVDSSGTLSTDEG